MKTRISAVAAFLVLGSAWFAAMSGANPESPGNVKQIQSGPYTLVGPFVHDNLAVYLIDGKETLGGRTYLTLQRRSIRK